MAATAKVSITSKHKYPMGAPDAKGDRRIFVTGIITMETATQTSTVTELGLDLSADIHTLEGCMIQGDSGYLCQYNYSARTIEIYVQGTASEASTPLTATSATSLNALVFHFFAWGF